MRAIKVGNVNVFPFRDMQELMDYTANDKETVIVSECRNYNESRRGSG